MSLSQTADLQSACELLRSLHRPGEPLLLPNAWDVATARAVAAAGFPVVATTSGGVAEALGFEDHEHAPADEMLAAAATTAFAVATSQAFGSSSGSPGRWSERSRLQPLCRSAVCEVLM